MRARRVLVYGVTGSGKSTAALRIGASLGLPVTLADEVAWQPGWQIMPGDEQREVFGARLAEDAWVLDTAYSEWLDVALERAEVLVCLDYPRWLSFQRLLRRTVARAVTREPVCNGNVETFRLMVQKDSILLWHFRSFTRKRTRMRAWAAESPGPQVHVFRRPRDLEAWIRSLTRAS